jgi:putative membrane protein
MIVRPSPTLWQVMFSLKGSILLSIYKRIFSVAILSTLIVIAHRAAPGLLPTFEGAPFALLGIALSVFLAFRNSSCYDRWWEARKLWGELVYSIRDLIRQSHVLPTEDRRYILRLAIAFTHGTVVHIRSGMDKQEVIKWLTPDEVKRYEGALHPADTIAQIIGERLALRHREGVISDIVYQMLDKTVTTMAHVLASCERIKFTPLPFAYTLLLHRTAYTFCFFLPLGFADTMGWWTPFATAFAAYTFFGLDALGDELERPFGHRPNALPIQAIAKVIESNLREALGDKELPVLPKPDKNNLLM